MLRRTYVLLTFGAALAAALPALSQVEPSATGGDVQDTEMVTPPLVSGLPYANTAGIDARSNYLNTAIAFVPGYVSNVQSEASGNQAGQLTYSIVPSISLARTTPRAKEQFSYSPTFIFYQKTSVLNSVDHNAAARMQYRLSPRMAVALQSSFVRTSNIFNSSYVFSNTVNGSPLSPTATAVAPFAEQMVYTVNGVLSYQFASNAMIGGGGSFNLFNISNPAQAEGLSNSSAVGGIVFYSRRVTRRQYFGLAYDYARVLTHPVNALSETQTHSFLPYYTAYIGRAFSLSLSVGGQRVDSSLTQYPTTTSWFPSGTVSAGWQGQRTTFAADFSHAVTSGGGLRDTYIADSFTSSGSWHFARTWSAESSVGYTSVDPVTTTSDIFLRSGKSIIGSVIVGHSIGEHFRVDAQYQRLHQTYSDIPVITALPDSNREAISLTYYFNKPLGR